MKAPVAPTKDGPRTNREIRAREVQLIDQEGRNQGVVQTADALQQAEDAGLDPYTRMTSDVYQDLFAEGSFTGKGIYDIAAFELALKDRLPDNRILSHDLLEGCYARSGYASDVQFYEENPSRYSTDVSRRHRWMRGDWQLAAWLLRRVPCVRW